MIERINLQQYKGYVGGSSVTHSAFSNMVSKIISDELTALDIKECSVYDFKGSTTEHLSAGNPDTRLVIFANTGFHGYEKDRKLIATQKYKLDKELTIGNVPNKYLNFFTPNENAHIFYSENNIPIFEWNKDGWQINILFNIFSSPSETTEKIFRYIMKRVNDEILKELAKEASWIHTSNKEKLTKTFQDQVKRSKERLIVRDEQDLANLEINVKDYKVRLKNAFESIYQKRRSIEAERTALENIAKTVIDDLNLIAKNNKVKDIQIKNGKIIIYTNPLTISADNGKKYYGGEYRIELKPENAEVLFFGSTKKPGYWTQADCHPHVNGRTGEACLGNAAPMIAELSAQMQIYALSLIAISFLEAANTSDSAGKRVVNWDEITENGSIIKVKHEKCAACEEDFPEGELHTVYDEIFVNENGEQVLEGEHLVCGDCRDNCYHYVDDLDGFVRD